MSMIERSCRRWKMSIQAISVFGKTPGATVVCEDRYDVRLIQSQPETLADFATSEPDKVHGPECAASKLSPLKEHAKRISPRNGEEFDQIFDSAKVRMPEYGARYPH